MADTDPGTATRVRVTVRFFAAARAAAGVEETGFALDAGSSVDGLVTALGVGDPALARVLERCSFLVDEVAVRDRHLPLRDGAEVDVLPPFAGG